MTLEELIYTRLVQEKELAESLAKYEGVPAVFLQKAPDDKAQGWGVSQYPRADYLVDMTADPERHSSGMVSVNVYSDDTGKPPEELAPLVRIALCDVVMQADDGAYCITWARTELFEMNDSQNPNSLVNGCSLTFLLIAFKIISESSRRFASISYNAISLSQSASLHMQSPNTFLAKTVLPAPINVIFAIFHPP